MREQRCVEAVVLRQLQPEHRKGPHLTGLEQHQLEPGGPQRMGNAPLIAARGLHPYPPHPLLLKPCHQRGMARSSVGHAHRLARGMAGNVEPLFADIDPGNDHAILHHLRRSFLVQEPMALATMRIR
nr:hypothetical protein [Sphingobium jiangsuense]